MSAPAWEAMVRSALDAAALSGTDDVPIGAVVFDPEGVELARAANRREADSDPTAHAEVLALRAAARAFGDGWRLPGCTIAVTVEPCTMCAGAITLSRVDAVVFGMIDVGELRRLFRVSRFDFWIACAAIVETGVGGVAPPAAAGSCEAGWQAARPRSRAATAAGRVQ